MARVKAAVAGTDETDEEREFMEGQRAVEADVPVEPADEPHEDDEPTDPEEGDPSNDEDLGDDEPAPAKDHRVPIAELQKERQKRKDLQGKIDGLERTYQRLLERLNAPAQPVTVQPAPAPAPEPEIPAYEADPIGHLHARLAQIEAQSRGTYQAMSEQQQLQQFGQALAAQEAIYRRDKPDYDAAVQFVRQQREADYQALGYGPDATNQLITREIVQTALSAMQEGRNPAQAFYAYAERRGWSAPAQPGGDPAVKLATVAKAQARGGSPKGGQAAKPQTSLADLAEMDDAAFDKAFNRIMKGT